MKEISEIDSKNRTEDKEDISDDTDMLSLYEESADDKGSVLDNTVDEKIDEETKKNLEFELTQIDEIISIGENIQQDNKAEALLDAIHTAYKELETL